MKTHRILSLCLAMLLCFSLIPAVSLSASAEGAADSDAMPAKLPDGNSVDKTKLWVDWSEKGVANTDHTITDDGFCKATADSKASWVANNGASTQSWRGASGIMFYVDASEANGVGFTFQFIMEGTRANTATTNANVRFYTYPEQRPHPTKKSVAYAYDSETGTWTDFGTSNRWDKMVNPDKTSGWYYVPLTSFYSMGGGEAVYAEDPTIGMNFVEFTSRFANQAIANLQLQSSYANQKIGDLYFVYSNPEAEDFGAGTPLLGTMDVTTIKDMANSKTSSGNRKALNTVSLSAQQQASASGIRFHVDTTKLGSAQLQLRLRLFAPTQASTVTDTIYANGGTSYATPSSSGWCWYVCRSDNSVAYYFDDEGNPVALRVVTDVSTAYESDIFDALPAGYNGDIYIPLESFWLSPGGAGSDGFGGVGNENKSGKSYLPYHVAGELYRFSQIVICHAISGNATENSVDYSNFELVYPETYIGGASVTLKNSLDVNFFARIGNATDAKMIFKIGSKTDEVTGSALENGRTKFVCSGILPQKVTDEITATLTAKVNGVAVSQTVTYSVREYCENMLARGDTSERVKKLLVDLLYYAEAAQIYADYKTDDLATKNLTEAQKAFRSADTTGDITASVGMSGTADESYKWYSATLRLENSVAIRIKFIAPSIDDLTLKVTLNGRLMTYTKEMIKKEGNGIYSILFDNIGANEYGDTVKILMQKNGTQIGQTLTYSVAAYIREVVESGSASEKALALVRALWHYGESARAMGRLDAALPMLETAGSDAGVMPSGDGERYVATYKDVTEAEYNAYVAKLTAAGFVAFDEYSANGNHFGTYTKGRTQVNLCFYPVRATFKILYGKTDTIPSLTKPETEELVTPTLTQLVRKSVDESSPNGAPGMGYVIQLSDGRYILIDGGSVDTNNEDAGALLDYLVAHKPASHEKPIIAAWIISHAHGDHILLPNQFLKDYHDKVVLEMTITNFPYFSKLQMKYENSEPLAGFISQFESYVSAYFPRAKQITAHTGQRFWIGDAYLEFFYSHEDEYPNLPGWANETSLVFRMTLGGKTCMFLGDLDQCAFMRDVWGSEVKSDILQVAHHGYNGGDLKLYQNIDPEICLWASDEWRFLNDPRCLGIQSGYEFNKWLRNDSIRARKHYHNSVTTIIYLKGTDTSVVTIE